MSKRYFFLDEGTPTHMECVKRFQLMLKFEKEAIYEKTIRKTVRCFPVIFSELAHQKNLPLYVVHNIMEYFLSKQPYFTKRNAYVVELTHAFQVNCESKMRNQEDKKDKKDKEDKKDKDTIDTPEEYIEEEVANILVASKKFRPYY
jgi:hypothetical protein